MIKLYISCILFFLFSFSWTIFFFYTLFILLLLLLLLSFAIIIIISFPFFFIFLAFILLLLLLFPLNLFFFFPILFYQSTSVLSEWFFLVVYYLSFRLKSFENFFILPILCNVNVIIISVGGARVMLEDDGLFFFFTLCL